MCVDKIFLSRASSASISSTCSTPSAATSDETSRIQTLRSADVSRAAERYTE